MRLIDADVLIKRLKHNSIFEKITDSRGMNTIEIIEEQPTAFDVEKVVEQLEEASHWEEATFDVDGYCNDDSWEVVYLDKAIEIVKSGCI